MPNYAPDAPALKPTAGLTYHAATAGDSFDNNGQTLVIIKNTSGGAITVTFDAPGISAPDQANTFDPDVAVSVPATTGERVAGPFPVSRFNDSTGRVQLAFSATAGLTWAAFRAL